MKFNKCVRCGCFFASENDVCPNCEKKDNVDKSFLKNYLENNDLPQNAESLAFKSGVSIKNINRYMNSNEFSYLKKSFNSIQNLNDTKIISESSSSSLSMDDDNYDSIIKFEI